MDERIFLALDAIEKRLYEISFLLTRLVSESECAEKCACTKYQHDATDSTFAEETAELVRKYEAGMVDGNG